MRTELELIEKIEKYLNNELSPVDQKAFEEQLNTDPVLQQEVALQRETMKGIERASLKKQVQGAGDRFRKGNNFRKWGLAGIVVLMIVAGIVTYKAFNLRPGPTIGKNISGYGDGIDSLQLPPLNEANDSNWARPDSMLPAQVFLLNTSRDTIVETSGGIVLSVPANGFLSAEGSTVGGSVQLVVKEALDAASIMKAGLSTMSGDRMLETGGMFFIDARQGEQVLKINPANTIYAAIPSDTVKPGMKLFKGKRTDKGGIDWIDPAPLDNGLTTSDIQSLNFYPPLYLDSLKRWGYDITNKKFTDSLYYSFAGELINRPAAIYPSDSDYSAPGKDSTASQGGQNADTAIGGHTSGQREQPNYHPCGLKPTDVKAIWNDHFQHTYIATKQFEERIKLLHRIGVSEVLGLYVENIDKDLFYTDSMIAANIKRSEYGRFAQAFENFASRHDGNVIGRTKNAARLAEYFRKKSSACSEAIRKTQREFWDKQAELDDAFYQKQSVYQQDTSKRLDQHFKEEFELNVKEAYRQLGVDPPAALNGPASNVYAAPITTAGWYNVDRYVYESVANQTTLDFTDKQTGKKAVIRYNPVSFSIADASSFDRISVYLLPDKISSFISLKDSGGVYNGKLDELMTYNMVAIAYKDDKAYFHSITNTGSRNYTDIKLALVSAKELTRNLNAISSKSQVMGLKNETDFIRFEIKDLKRQKQNIERIRLKERLYKIIFPCSPDATAAATIAMESDSSNK